jgi:hypothetical protein
MKDVTGTVVTTGNIDTTNAKKGSISERGMGVVMSILSKMYSNAPLAVLREYSCNARDSHIASGQTWPIEVTLPSALQPTLLIQDFGLGMTRDEIETYFLEYGESTKGDTNDLVGAFGIGSKSAFTLGHQFIVTGVKNGAKTVAQLSLDGNNVLSCKIMREQETTEPNGVLISLAVDDVQAMRETADHFFSFWSEGTVLVDGETPTTLVSTGTSINDSTWLVQDHEGQVIVEMGQVPYVVGRDILRKVARDLSETPAGAQAQALVDWYSSTSLVFHVEIGDCDIAPNREALRDTPHTLATLGGLLSSLVADLASSVQAKVDQARSPFHASIVLEQALNDLEPFKVKRSSIAFAGIALKKEVKVDLTSLFLARKSYRSDVKVVGREADFTLDAKRAPHVLVVTGVPAADVSKVQRYAKRFLENYTLGEGDDERSVKWILVSEEASGEAEWLSWGDGVGAPTLTLTEYRAALRAMRDSNPRLKTEPSYTTGWSTASRDLDDRDLLSDILDWGKDIVLYHDSAVRVSRVARRALAEHTPVVLLGQQSEDALRKRVEADGRVRILTHVEREEIVRAYARQQFATITEAERAALGAVAWLNTHDADDWDRLGRILGEESITSKTYHEVRDTVALAEMVAADISQERRAVLSEVAAHLGTEVEYPSFDAEIPDLSDAFPLIGHLVNYGGYAFRRNEALRNEALTLLNAK